MEKKEEEGENHLLVACWPEPFAFAYTKEEEKSYKSFPFTEEGLEEARLYLMENGKGGKGEEGNHWGNRRDCQRKIHRTFHPPKGLFLSYFANGRVG